MNLEETLRPLGLPNGAKVAGWRVQGRILHVLITGGSRVDDETVRLAVAAAVGDTYSRTIINRLA